MLRLRLLVESLAFPVIGRHSPSGPDSAGTLLAWLMLRTSKWRNRQRITLIADVLHVVADNIAASGTAG